MGVEPLNVVMKLTRVNGQPTAKLSDSPGKTLCHDETFLAYLRQVFGLAQPLAGAEAVRHPDGPASESPRHPPA